MSNETQRSAADGGILSDANSSQYLTFMLDGEEYGVDILRVQEIKGWDRATPIPNTPDYIKGVINLRGTVVPIIDLRRRFALEQVDYGNTTVIMVLKVNGEKGERTMGFVVDAVSDVYNVEKSQLKPPPEFGGAVSTDFIKGLVTVDTKMLILLDIDRLVTTDAAVEAPAVAH